MGMVNVSASLRSLLALADGVGCRGCVILGPIPLGKQRTVVFLRVLSVCLVGGDDPAGWCFGPVLRSLGPRELE